ncbi:MAG: HTH domain-containing protein [Candidatus Aenigmatarchaeota archaeon]
MSVTNSVRFVADELNCSKSTVWNIIRSLKNCGLIETNGCIRLTYYAKILMEVIE